MDLIIAEKPEVGRAVAKTLSKNATSQKGYIECPDINTTVTWAVGHLMREQEPHEYNPDLKKWNLDDLPLAWPPLLKVNEKTRAQLSIIKGLISKAKRVINACDIDGAGQAIFDQIMEHTRCNKQQFRVLITDNNRIKKAFETLRPNSDFYGLGLNERARSIADLRYGINLSRALTLQADKQGYKTSLYTGRVQAGFVGLIVRRERTIKYFEPEHYYLVTCDIENEAGDLIKGLRLVVDDSSIVDDKGRIIDKNVSNIKAGMLNGAVTQVSSVETKELFDSPPLPYDLNTLQADASELLGLKPKQVLTITQALRDKYSAITYNRSDCPYLPDEVHAEAPEILSALQELEEFDHIIEYCDYSIKSRAFDSAKVDAHHGIIPTNNMQGIDDMSDDEFDVYTLITRNFVAQFYPKRAKKQFSYTVQASGETVSGKKIAVTSRGWDILFKNQEELEDEDLATLELLESFEEGTTVQLHSHSQPQATKPPAHYTVSSFLKDTTQTAKYVENQEIRKLLLEKDKGKAKESGGLGTSATRTEIFDKLVKESIIQVNSKNIVTPTEKGYLLHDTLPASVVSPEMTAVWSFKQRCIEEGSLTIGEFVDYIDHVCSQEVSKIKQGINIPSHLIDANKPTSVTQCVHCGELKMESKTGKHGEYWKCTGCDQTTPDYKGVPFQPTDCEKCGKPMRPVKAKGRGKKAFLGCSGYKDGCQHTIN